MAAVTTHNHSGPQENKVCHCFHIVSPYNFNCVSQFLLHSLFIIIHFQVYPNSLFLRQRLYVVWASLVAQLVKNFAANAGDTRGPGSILGQEDPLEKITAICSGSLA